MSNEKEFEREARYAVFKLSRLEGHEIARLQELFKEGHPAVVHDCVVVESDWPMYEDVWSGIEKMARGHAVPSTAELSAYVEYLENHIKYLESTLTVPHRGPGL